MTKGDDDGAAVPRAIELSDHFRSWLEGNGSSATALEAVLTATRARATGLWRLEGEHLVLLGFRAVADMAPQVSEAFAAATRRTPLAADDLAIVKAFTTRQPTQGRLQAHDLPGSASWLQRFGAVESLAVPALAGTETVGVLAISSCEAIPSGGPVWTLMVDLTAAITPSLT